MGALAGAMIQWGKTSVFLISVTEQNKCVAGRQYKSTEYRFVHEGKLLAPPRMLPACYVQAVNKILPHFHFMNGSGF